jgi:eukaryotic-like serine/threonine-protein kinase
MHQDLTVGSKLEHFEITGRLGIGGAGAVFRAKNLNDGKEYALKTLTSETTINEEIHKRFVREISVAQKLKHENIVAYDYCGFDENVLYYTMELVPWGSLSDVLAKKKKLAWQDAVECGIDICHGLEHLHESKIVHRDLKPANIFLSDDGRLKLGDFGLARDLDSMRLTVEGFTVGTAKYLAPEQAMAKPVDGRTDLYALGCLMFEMLTGRPPFICEDQSSQALIFRDLMGKHVKAKPPLVSDFVSDCPPRLVSLVDQLLAKKPDDRPISAANVAETLQSILKPTEKPVVEPGQGGEPSIQETKSLTSRLVEGGPTERKNNKFGILIALAVVIIGGVILAVVQSQK